MVWLGIAVLMMVGAVIVYRRSQKDRDQLGLPAGEVIYTDHGTWLPQSEPLLSEEFNLIGRPDYLISDPQGEIIPVEIKSVSAPQAPHQGHVLQLAAYCLLVDLNYGIRPAYGVLQYRDKAFAVEYSNSLEQDLILLLSEMQSNRLARNVSRGHNHRGRCLQCVFSGDCEDSLA